MKRARPQPGPSTTRAWWRRSLLAPSNLIIGVVLTVLTTWMAVLITPLDFTEPGRHPYILVNERDTAWPTTVPVNWPARALECHREQRWLAECRTWGWGWELAFSVSRTSYGWPHLAMRTTDIVEFQPNAIRLPAGVLEEGFVGPTWFNGTMNIPGVGPVTGARTFPLRPHFPGFLFNTLFYAALFAGTRLTFTALRRAHRHRRGLCPACAYNLRGLPQTTTRCPECAHPR